MTPDEKQVIVAIWKETVDVQKHFNEIGMRIRGMFVTILIAFFAAMGFIIDKKMTLVFGALTIQYAAVVPLLGIFTTWLFYFIDRYWYHRLLTGSVRHAIQIENLYKSEIPELGLSGSIGKESPYKPGRSTSLLAGIVVSDLKWQKDGELHSDGKIELFYKSVMALLLAITILISFTGGITWSGDSTTSTDRKVATGQTRKFELSGHSESRDGVTTSSSIYLREELRASNEEPQSAPAATTIAP